MSVIHWSETELGAIVAYGIRRQAQGADIEAYRVELANDAEAYSHANTRAFAASYRDEADASPALAVSIAAASRRWRLSDPDLPKKARHVACLLNYNQIDQNGRDHMDIDEALATLRLVDVILVGAVEEFDQRR
jgi:hypothetical protein